MWSNNIRSHGFWSLVFCAYGIVVSGSVSAAEQKWHKDPYTQEAHVLAQLAVYTPLCSDAQAQKGFPVARLISGYCLGKSEQYWGLFKAFCVSGDDWGGEDAVKDTSEGKVSVGEKIIHKGYTRYEKYVACKDTEFYTKDLPRSWHRLQFMQFCDREFLSVCKRFKVAIKASEYNIPCVTVSYLFPTEEHITELIKYYREKKQKMCAIL